MGNSNSVDDRADLVTTSKNPGPVIILVPFIILFLHYFFFGIINAEPWWFKIPFITMLPLALFFIWVLMEGGYITGKGKCIITSDRITFSFPSGRITKWLIKKKIFNPSTEFFQLSWNEIKSIQFEAKPNNKKVDSTSNLIDRIVISDTKGMTYEIDDSAFMYPGNRKFKSIFNELKLRASSKGITFVTIFD